MIKIDKGEVEIKGTFSELMAETTSLLKTLRESFDCSEKEMDEYLQQAFELSKMDRKQVADAALAKLNEAMNILKNKLMKEIDEMEEEDEHE